MEKIKILKTVLSQIISDIDSGNSNASDEELDKIIDVIN